MAEQRNLLLEIPDEVDRYELRELLDLRVGGPGQYDGDSRRRLYLPQAREACRLVLVYHKDSLSTLQRIEPGPAFDETEWKRVQSEVCDSLLSGPMKVGRDYCFSGRRVLGSWRGNESGVQILPPPTGTAGAPVEMAQHPFLLECSMRETREWRLTNSRRRRRVRSIALLLNVLLNTQIRVHWSVQPDSLWVNVPGVDTRRFKFDRLRRWFRLPPRPPPPFRVEWGQEHFFAPLKRIVGCIANAGNRRQCVPRTYTSASIFGRPASSVRLGPVPIRVQPSPKGRSPKTRPLIVLASPCFTVWISPYGGFVCRNGFGYRSAG
jgi:hypothetical protein